MSMTTPFVKVCGITTAEDALHAVAEGASAVGFIFSRQSPRWVSPEIAAGIIARLPRTITTVGVFVDEPIESLRATAAATRIQMAQLHGDETVEYADAVGLPILRALRVGDVEASGWPTASPILLDAIGPAARGGTGRTVDWGEAAVVAARRQVILAGGLTPDNVAEAIAVVRPAGVDVSSGVERTPGVKDADKVTRFLARAKAAFEAYQ